MQVFAMFGTIALKGGQAVINGLKAIDKGASAASAKLKSFGDKSQEVGRTMTTHVSAPLVGLSTAAVVTGAKFDEQMSKVAAVTGATGKEFEALRNQAKELGATTQFSASEAASGMEFLARAGFKTKDIMSAMPGMLNLAAAGALDLGRAADITSNIMSGFGIKASEAGHVADVLAYASANANTNVEQLGEAMVYLAPVAQTMGWSLHESTAAVMALSDAGIQGAQAGAAFSTSLQRLAKPTGDMKKAMSELGLSFFDSQGKMKPLPAIIQELEEKTKGMTDQQKAALLTTLFGAEAYKHWSVLLERGSDSLDEMTKSLEQSDGTSAKMAKTMNDNLIGSFRSLMSALEGLAIAFSDVMAPAIRKAADFLTDLTRKFTGLDEGTKKVIVVIAAIAAGIGPLIMGLGLLAKGIVGTITAIKSIVTAFKMVGTALNVLRVAFMANPFMLIVTAIAIVVTLVIMHWDTIKEYLITAWNWIKDTAASVWNGIKDFFSNVWEGIKAIVLAAVTWYLNRVRQNWELIKTITTTVWNAIKSFFSNIWNGIKNIVQSAVTWYLNRVKQNWQTIKSITTSVWNGIKSFFTSVWNGIKSFVSSAVNGIRSIITSIWNSIKSVTSSVWNSIKNTISQGINSAWNTIKGYAGRFLSAGKALLESLAKGIAQGLQKAISAVKNGMAKIRSFLPFSPAKEGPLRDLDKSGESFFPTFAAGLERGSRPMLRSIASNMLKARRMMEGGGQMTIGGATGNVGGTPATMAAAGGVVITGNTFHIREEADIQRVAQRLYELQRKRQRGPGGRI